MGNLGLGIHCNNCPLKDKRTVENYNHSPEDFIEGNPNSNIWIIGLNPGFEKGANKLKERKKDILSLPKSINDPYFSKFKRVSSGLFKEDGKAKFAHTDLVKCASQNFTSKSMGANINDIIYNCSSYLKDHISIYSPSIILAAGSHTQMELVRLFKPYTNPYEFILENTSFSFLNNKKTIQVVFSDHVGQMSYTNGNRVAREISELAKLQKLLGNNETLNDLM